VRSVKAGSCLARLTLCTEISGTIHEIKAAMARKAMTKRTSTARVRPNPRRVR